MDVIDALVGSGGVASWAALRDAGCSPHFIREALLGGRARRVSRGIFAVPDADPAIVAVLRTGGVLSCCSAASTHGLPLRTPPPAAHVTVPRNRSRVRAGSLVVHRRDLDPEDVRRGCTGPRRTVLDLVAELPFADAVAAMDAALHRGVPLEAFTGRTGRGAAVLRRVLAAADGRCMSYLETHTRLLICDLGLVLPQAYIPGVGYLDFLLDGWLAIEADGYDYHSSRTDYLNDRRRHAALTQLGYGLLRFGYEDVLGDPDGVRSLVRTVLRRGPGPGFTPQHTNSPDLGP